MFDHCCMGQKTLGGIVLACRAEKEPSLETVWAIVALEMRYCDFGLRMNKAEERLGSFGVSVGIDKRKV